MSVVPPEPQPARLRAMGLGEILDSAIQLYRKNFLLFFGVVGLIFIPSYLVVSYFLSTGLVELMQVIQPLNEQAVQPDELGGLLGDMLESYLVLIVPALAFEMLVRPIAVGALIYAASRRIFDQPMSIGAAYAGLFGNFWGFYGAVLLAGLVKAVGMIFCIAPGVIFSIMFALVAEVAMIERLGGGRAMGRAYELARNEWGKIFLLGLLLLVMIMVISFGARELVELLFSLDLDDPLGMSFGALFWSNFVAQFVEVLVVPFTTVAWLLLFYDIKVRKEGYDIEVMAQALEQALPPAASALPVPAPGEQDGPGRGPGS